MECSPVLARLLNSSKELQMSMKTQITEEQAVATPVEARPLQEIVNMVRRDSQIEPQIYLKETEVPHGGE